ncbi:MAG TPA: TIGR03435 family protein [Candidatus Angelobacter sp.]
MLAVFVLLSTPPDGQSQKDVSSPPAFDVASVKPVQPSDPRGSRTGFSMAPSSDGVKLTITNATLLACIERAYGLREYQVSGPAWIKSEHYDIVAIGPRVGTKQVWKMLQTLLMDRFQMSLHRETKVLPVYELVVAKNGEKIHEVDSHGPSGIGGDKGKIIAKKTSMAQLAEVLSSQIDRPVLDMNGLSGVFDFTLEYSRQESPLDGRDANDPENDPFPAPLLPQALREQLGLDLKANKAPLEILVIDSANKVPTAN